MSLSDWAKNDWLKAHKTSEQEIDGLLSIVERELKDSQVKGISSDGKFTHAYRAALTLATILLFKSGYAPARGQSHHHRTIEETETEADELVEFAKGFRKEVETWLRGK